MDEPGGRFPAGSTIKIARPRAHVSAGPQPIGDLIPSVLRDLARDVGANTFAAIRYRQLALDLEGHSAELAA